MEQSMLSLSKQAQMGGNLEKFSSILGYTVGKIELNYFEQSEKKVVHTIGFLIQPNIILCLYKQIKRLKDRGIEMNIIFYPTDPKTTFKYGISNANDFVSVHKILTLPEIKDKTNYDPMDPAYHEKEWCILSLKNSLGDFIYTINHQEPEYFSISVCPKEIQKVIFVFFSKNNETRGDYVSVSIDNSKIILGNETYENNNDNLITTTVKKQKIYIILQSSFMLNDTEGFLFNYSESKYNIIGVYNGSPNAKKNVAFVEQNYKNDLENIQATLGRLSDAEYGIYELDMFMKERDIDIIERISKDIKQIHFRDYGVKAFPHSVYSEFLGYFNSYSKVNMLLNYGELLLDKISKKLKIQLRNVDLELLIKRLCNDCCVGTSTECKPLEKLEIKNENISPMTFKIALETFYMSSMINSLGIYEVSINSQYGGWIAELFFHNPSRIKELILHNNKIKLETFEIIFKALVQTKVEVISFFKNSFYIEDEFIQTKLSFFNLSKIPSIKRLYLRTLKMSSNGLIKMFQQMKEESIKLKDINAKNVKDNRETYFNKNFKSQDKDKYENKTNSERENLRVFNFSENFLNTEIMFEISGWLSNYICLQELYLQNCAINDNSLNLLVTCLQNHHLLNELDLSKNKITGTTIANLSELLNLRGLPEDKSNKKDNKKGDLSKSKKVIITGITKAFPAPIPVILLNLNLNHNPLGNEGVSDFFENLTEGCMPFKIELDDTGFGAPALEQIIVSLKASIPVYSISMAKNAFTDRTFIDIFQDFGLSIKSNYYIRKITINKNFISKDILLKMFEPITTLEKVNSFGAQERIYRPSFSIVCDPLVTIEEAYSLYHRYLNTNQDDNFMLFDVDEIVQKIKEHELLMSEKGNMNSIPEPSSKIKLKREFNSEVINIKEKKNSITEFEKNYEDLIYYISYCK